MAHSRSPAMMEAAGLRYQRLPVPPDLFATTVRALPAAGFRGANVTIPHKEAALAAADEATPEARAIGAANTLTFSADGAIHAANTDARGLLDALGDAPAGTALVLGAGGSARAAAYALAAAGAEVAVWNRTAARAEELAAGLRGAPRPGVAGVPRIAAVAAPRPADLLVNCTAVGLDDPARTFEDLPLRPEDLGRYTTVVDLVYRAGGTPLVAAARAAGARTIDGLEILVRQGARSYAVWTGEAAPLERMRAAAADP